jgi:hypothetical protein
MVRGFIDGEYQDGEIRGLGFLCGMRNMGKTTEMARLFSECTGGFVFFDTTSKHGHLFPAAVVFSQPGRLREYLLINRGRRFQVVYQPRGGEIDEHFRAVCLVVSTFGWMIFGIDELDKFCGQRWGAKGMPPELAVLVDYGRHHRVSILGSARRPKAIAPAYRGEAEMRVFRLKEEGAIEYFEGELGKETAAQLRSLPQFYYLHCMQDCDPVVRGGPRSVESHGSL